MFGIASILFNQRLPCFRDSSGHRTEIPDNNRTNRTLGERTDTRMLINRTHTDRVLNEDFRTRREFQHVFFTLANYTVLVFNMLFLTSAFACYGTIFHVFRKGRRGRVGQEDKQGIWAVFRKSRFHVQALIISTNILFIIPADFVWTFVISPSKVGSIFLIRLMLILNPKIFILCVKILLNF